MFIQIKKALATYVAISFCAVHTYSQVNLQQPNFVDYLVSSGWNQANGIVYDSTGQSYVWELKGKIYVVDTAGNKIATPLLNISDEVGNWRSHGLHGVCLDPNFRTNGYFYCYYAVDRYHLLNFGNGNYNSNANAYYDATILRVTRFTANSATNFTTLIPNSRLVLVGENKKTGIPLLHVTHDGGTILFGQDGSLLVFTGDGADYAQNDVGSAPGTYWSQALTDTIIRTAENVGDFRSQLLNSHNGKILRIDPATGDGISSNPYFDSANPRSPKSRVYALGLRQPYRCSIIPNTGSTNLNDCEPGHLFVSEVGWSLWEGVWVVREKGMNLGWPIFEGLNRVSALQAPIYNKDMPNPLNGSGGCNKPYFSFQNLLKNSLLPNPSFPNPCNNNVQIPNNIPKWKWLPPIINYRHNQNITQVPLVVGDSTVPVSMSSPQANVIGTEFKGNASMAGPWYTGNQYPSTYKNTFFNVDYGEQWIKNFVLDSNYKVTEVRPFANNLGEIVYLTMNKKDGCLYYLKLEGELHKICYLDSNNAPPIAAINIDQTYSSTNSITINCSANNSTDPEGQPLTYLWDFGNGIISNAADTQLTITTTGTEPEVVTISLRVTDAGGLDDATTQNVHLNNYPPIVNITSIEDSALYSIGEAENLHLKANVIDNSADSTLTYTWHSILFHETHNHPEPFDNEHETYQLITNDGCGSEVFWWEVNLSVTDAQGLKSSDVVRLYPNCVMPEAVISSNQSVCKSAPISFNSLSENASSIKWIFETASISESIVPNPTVTYNAPGVYKVTLVANNILGSDTAIKYITVYSNNQTISILTSPNDTVCQGQQLQIQATTSGTNNTYSWMTAGTVIPNETSNTIITTANGGYVCVVTDSNGCTKSSKTQKAFFMAQHANINAPNGKTICSNDSALLVANVGNYTYQWTENGVNISGANADTYYATTAGNYKCLVTNYLGCNKLSNSIKVVINCKLADLLHNNYSKLVLMPNPVQQELYVSFELDTDEKVALNVLDETGKKIISATSKSYPKGLQQEIINVSQLHDGFYFLQLNGTTFQKAMPFNVIRNKQ